MSETTRNQRRTLQGVVTSTAATKTITVEVERTYRHAKYGKILREKKKYMAHDEQETASVGDTVELRAVRPLSKRKRWSLVSVVDKADLAGDFEGGTSS